MKLIILDRDGVINETDGEPIRSPNDWKPIAGSLEAIARLTHAGYRVMVATNQPGIGEGSLSFDDLNAVHDRMREALSELGGKIDAVFYCPHARDAGCDCRKPKPGMLNEIARRMQADLSVVPFIGDRAHDVGAAVAAGAQPLLVRTGMGLTTLAENAAVVADVPVYDDLESAVAEILK